LQHFISTAEFAERMPGAGMVKLSPNIKSLFFSRGLRGTPHLPGKLSNPAAIGTVTHHPVAGIHRGCPSSALDKSNYI